MGSMEKMVRNQEKVDRMPSWHKTEGMDHRQSSKLQAVMISQILWSLQALCSIIRIRRLTTYSPFKIEVKNYKSKQTVVEAAREEMEAMEKMASVDLQDKTAMMAATVGKRHLGQTVEKAETLRSKSMRTTWIFSCWLGILRSLAGKEVTQASMEKAAKGAQEDSVMMTTWLDQMGKMVRPALQ